jgi:hypothetical protein
MMDLITRDRVARYLPAVTLSAGEVATLDVLIATASQAIATYCRRGFAVETRDELYDGVPDRILLLEHYPLVRVDRVARRPEPVLRVVNDSADNQRAGVHLGDSGMTLTRLASGAAHNDFIPFDSSPTLAHVVEAVNELDGGWSATLTASQWSAFPSVDLASFRGVHAAKDRPAELRLHVEELASFDLDASHGFLIRTGGGADDFPLWTGGAKHWRVVYTAGFESIPEDVQEACCQLVASLYWQTKRDPGLLHDASRRERVVPAELPATCRLLLNPYRNFRV